MKNKYIHHAHISERKTRQLIKCFSSNLTATQTAEMIGLNLNTVDRLFSKLRARIMEKAQANLPEQGEYEADESYFGPCRVKGKRGRGAGGKTIVFGLFKRDGNVYTEIVPDAKAVTLQAII